MLNFSYKTNYMRKLLFSILTLLLTSAGMLQAQKTYLHCGKMVDVNTLQIKERMTIVVEANKIVEVKSGYAAGTSSDKVIDLTKFTAMPGLMDMHVHLEGETKKGGALERFTQNPEEIAFESLKYAEITLMSGFTTVRDLGGSGVNIALRNAINKGLVTGPRIFTAGKAIGTTGGHADPTNGFRRDLMGDPGPKEGVVNGVEDGRKAVRQRYKDGADLIKITATGGVLSLAKNGQNPQFTEEEIKTIVETAKDYGFIVAAHAHGAEGIKRAIRAGVTSIEHGTLMDDEAIELFKKYGTWYVPTITAGKSVADSAKIPGYYQPIVVPKAISIGAQIQSTFAKAYKAGVKVAFGTDAAVFAHGKNYMEFQYMVEAGMPALETIKCATLNAADLLGMKNTLGSIEVGKIADIVAVEGDPSVDIKVMKNVVFVMKEGIVYKTK
jgi:imidazolonepropionase-like amidohydrolase